MASHRLRLHLYSIRGRGSVTPSRHASFHNYRSQCRYRALYDDASTRSSEKTPCRTTSRGIPTAALEPVCYYAAFVLLQYLYSFREQPQSAGGTCACKKSAIRL